MYMYMYMYMHMHMYMHMCARVCICICPVERLTLRSRHGSVDRSVEGDRLVLLVALNRPGPAAHTMHMSQLVHSMHAHI